MNRGLVNSIERIDPRLFRAFLAAAETQNFTLAAKKAQMTQSGISQHILKLEEQLGVCLFKRASKAVLLNEAGEELLAYIKRYADTVESLIGGFKENSDNLKGLVSYAMPNSCLLSPHLDKLLERRLSHPEIELDITIAPNEEVVRLVIAGNVDFGFVTAKINNPALSYDKFCDEEFVVVSSNKKWLDELDEKSIRTLPFISFPGMPVYFNVWLAAQFPKLKNFDYDSLNIVAKISQLDGGLKFIKGGVGLAALPKHCVADLLAKGVIHQAKLKPVGNTIYFVRLKESELHPRAATLIKWFKDMV